MGSENQKKTLLSFGGLIEWFKNLKNNILKNKTQHQQQHTTVKRNNKKTYNMNDYNLIKPIYYEKSKENEIAIYQEANLKYAHKLNVSSPSLSLSLSLCVCVLC